MTIQTDKRHLSILLVVLLACHVIGVVVMASVPPVSRDALTHHLAVPKLWIQRGGIYEIPDLPLSYYPMNLDLLYTIPLLFGNDIVPKYIHFAFALATAGLIFGYLNKRIGQLYALTGALLFLTIPIVVKLSISVYVDLGLIFFTTLSWVSLFRWKETGFRLRWLTLSAISCGLALGTKYNGLISLFLLAFLPSYLYLKGVQQAGRNPAIRLQLRGLGYSVAFVTIAVGVFSPWMIKNIIWTGNPVYPLYKEYFQAERIVRRPVWLKNNPTGDRSENGHDSSGGITSHFLVRKHVYGESWWQTASIPLRIFFQGQDDDPKFFDGKLNPLLALLPFLVFLSGPHHSGRFSRELLVLAVFSWLFLIMVFFQADMRIRWISPIIPALVALSMAGVSSLQHFCSVRKRSVVNRVCQGTMWILLSVLFGMNLVYAINLFNKVDPLSYLSGRTSRDAYIQRFRPEYNALVFANQNTPPDAVILCLFLGNRRYYSDRQLNFDYDFFKNVIRNSNSPEQVDQGLEFLGVTHFLIREDLFMRWAQNNFTPPEQQLMEAFFAKFAKALFSGSGYTLMKV